MKTGIAGRIGMCWRCSESQQIGSNMGMTIHYSMYQSCSLKAICIKYSNSSVINPMNMIHCYNHICYLFIIYSTITQKTSLLDFSLILKHLDQFSGKPCFLRYYLHSDLCRRSIFLTTL